MGLGERRARQVIESVFTFDNVGDAQSAVRRDLSSKTAQERLVKELVEHAIAISGDSSSESLLLLTEAAKERVQQFVEGSQAASSGCGGFS